MPSRPMLTTPARSDHRPARPASAIGMKAAIASRRVPAESSSLLPVITRANETSAKATSSQAHSGDLAARRVRTGARGSGAERLVGDGHAGDLRRRCRSGRAARPRRAAPGALV